MDTSNVVMTLISIGMMLFGCAATIIWIWSLYDVITKEQGENNEKLIWILVLIFLGILGTVIYYFVRRPERIRKYGK